WAGALWRAINIGVFAFGVLRLTRLAAPSSTLAFNIIVTSIAALLSWSAARHGQMTLVMGGLMMSAVADLHARSFWRASIALALAVAFKPLAIVLVLLAAALYPRTSWRIALVFLGIGLAPFAFQSTEYVLSQYRAVPDMFRDAAENGLETPYA